MAFLFLDRINRMDKMVSEKSKSSAAGNSVDSVHSVEKSLPNSKKIFVAGKLHPDLRVPFREITLAPTKTMSGEIEVNEPVRVYDTSGPWGDPATDVDVTKGLPPLRASWIRGRCDVEEIEGRKVQPIDDGNGQSGSDLPAPSFSRRPLRAKPGSCVTQLAYARRGIITPEMEFIAIRENGDAEVRGQRSEDRNSLNHRHEGSEPIGNFRFFRTHFVHSVSSVCKTKKAMRGKNPPSPRLRRGSNERIDIFEGVARLIKFCELRGQGAHGSDQPPVRLGLLASFGGITRIRFKGFV